MASASDTEGQAKIQGPQGPTATRAQEELLRRPPKGVGLGSCQYRVVVYLRHFQFPQEHGTIILVFIQASSVGAFQNSDPGPPPTAIPGNQLPASSSPPLGAEEQDGSHIWGPQDHINMKTLHSGSQAQDKQDSPNHVCRTVAFTWPLGPLTLAAKALCRRAVTNRARPDLAWSFPLPTGLAGEECYHETGSAALAR